MPNEKPDSFTYRPAFALLKKIFFKNKSSQHRGKEDKAVLAAVLELPNFAVDQEGFGSLSTALAIAWHGTGDSVLIKYLLGHACCTDPRR